MIDFWRKWESSSLRIFFLGIVIATVAFCCTLLPVSSPIAGAASPQELACKGSGGNWNGGKCETDSAKGPTVPATIKAVINILLFVIGIIAVIVIVISALRIVNSGGDSQQVSKARDSIIYALVGLVVAALAYAIVNFVLDRLS